MTAIAAHRRYEGHDCLHIYFRHFVRLLNPLTINRYMAPEVATCQDYGFACDVYSISLVLWEICTLKKAFHDVKDIVAFNKEVVRGHKRPSTASISSLTLRDLLVRGWDRDASSRPSFSSIVKSLECEVADTLPKPSRGFTFLAQRASKKSKQVNQINSPILNAKNLALIRKSNYCDRRH